MMSDARQRALVACVLLPALLAFAFGSSLEVLHPIEEQAAGVQAHHHSERGPVAHDAARVFGPHNHFCAHSNALAHVAALATSFQRLVTHLPAPVRTADLVARPHFHVFDRGPPVL